MIVEIEDEEEKGTIRIMGEKETAEVTTIEKVIIGEMVMTTVVGVDSYRGYIDIEIQE